MFLNKRSVSPLIATILIIVVSVILITVILTWGSSFAKEKLSITKSSAIQNTDFTGLITNRSLSANDILISNNHSSRDLNITGYKLIASLDNDLYSYFENKIYYLEDPLVIGSRQAELLQINCYPEESFFIDLLTDQNTYVRTQVLAGSINDIDPLRCRLILDFDSSSGVLRENTGKTLTPVDVEMVSIGEYYSAEFNGTTSKIDTGSDFIGTKAVTICGWIYPIRRGGRVITNGKFELSLSSSYDKFFVWSDASTIKYSGVITFNKWYFLSLIRKSDGKITFYLGDKNTAPSLSSTADQYSGTSEVGSTNVFIGGNPYINAQIPNFKVYEGILDLEKMTQIWSNTKEKIK